MVNYQVYSNHGPRFIIGHTLLKHDFTYIGFKNSSCLKQLCLGVWNLAYRFTKRSSKKIIQIMSLGSLMAPPKKSKSSKWLQRVKFEPALRVSVIYIVKPSKIFFLNSYMLELRYLGWNIACGFLPGLFIIWSWGQNWPSPWGSLVNLRGQFILIYMQYLSNVRNYWKFSHT